MTASTATRGTVEAHVDTEAGVVHTSDQRSRWFVEHRPFLVALILGVAIRAVVMLAFTPALMVSDGPRYLRILDTFSPAQDRVVGYSLLVLHPVSLFTENLLAVATVQHLMGLATAVLLYVLLRRWGATRWPATPATLPVLFDAMPLVLEHAPLRDAPFVLLVTAGVAALGWRRRPTLALTLVAGLLLGASVTVRQVGLPLLLTWTAFCLLVGTQWRARLATGLVFTIGFLVPVGAYGAWYHSEHDTYALSEVGGRSAYMRTTTFVDCSGLSIPQYQRVLCPPEPRGARQDPSIYGWSDPRTVWSLEPPPGTTREDAMRNFAREAITEQPADYAMVVARDFALNFDVGRGDRFEFDGSWKWRFSSFVDLEPDTWTGPAFEAHGGQQLSSQQPYADALVAYQRVGYLPGPLLLGCLALGLVGAFGWGRARHSGSRPMCLLLTLSGLALIVVPAVTTQFIWRYQLPALVLLPGSAALAFTALRDRHRVAGTVATPRTD
ncbi:hypothetical protein BH20ACT3_BH20ACT3_01380 [soil metagenome]